VVAHGSESPVCLFDGQLNGNFIYQMRRHDAKRGLWVLRGDKLFYSTHSDPKIGYTEFVHSDNEILALIIKYDPEYVVIEETSANLEGKPHLPMADLLRRTLREHPKKFVAVAEITLASDANRYQDGKLVIYHNVERNPNRASVLDFEMLGLGRSLQTSMPDGTPP
jgi:hypothetical protein